MDEIHWTPFFDNLQHFIIINFDIYIISLSYYGSMQIKTNYDDL